MFALDPFISGTKVGGRLSLVPIAAMRQKINEKLGLSVVFVLRAQLETFLCSVSSL